MVLEFGFQIYRVGYYETEEMIRILGGRKGIIGLCFFGLLSCLRDEIEVNELWPVMETDKSEFQGRSFAGLIQILDYHTTLFGINNISINNNNLGDLHYCTKRSIYGAVTDCISYLLDAQSLQSSGQPLSPFKERLAAIANELSPSIVFNEIIEMKFEKPPTDYIGQGPIRYALPLTPV